MCEGHIIFNGRPEEIRPRIEALGLELPKFMSPTDFIIKVMDKDEIQVEYEKKNGRPAANPRIIEEIFKKRIQFFSFYEKKSTYLTLDIPNSIKKSSITDPSLMKESLKKDMILQINPDKNDPLEQERRRRNRPRWQISQFFILMWMYMAYFFKNKRGCITVFLNIIFSNGMFFIVYHHLGEPEYDTIAAIQNRRGLSYMLCIMFTFAGINYSLPSLITSRKLFMKDKDARLYSELPFYLAQLFHTLPMYVLVYFGVIFLYYYVVGLNQDPNLFYNVLNTYFFIFVGGFVAGQAVAIIISSFCDSLGTATILATIVTTPFLVSTGYMSNVRSMAKPLQWVAYLNFLRFAYQGFLLTEFQDSQRYVDACVTWKSCPYDVSKKCQYKIPEAFNSQCDPKQIMDYEQTELWTNMVFISGLVGGCWLLGFIFFKVKSNLKKMKYRKNQLLREEIDKDMKRASSILFDQLKIK